MDHGLARIVVLMILQSAGGMILMISCLPVTYIEGLSVMLIVFIGNARQ